jgi:hypothetical protein
VQWHPRGPERGRKAQQFEMLMNEFPRRTLLMPKRDGANRKSEDGHSHTVRRMGCHHARLTTHLRLFCVLELAFGGMIVAASARSLVARREIVWILFTSGRGFVRALIRPRELVQGGSPNLVSHPLNYRSRIR